MEYQVPAERGPECLSEVVATIARLGLPVAFPLEYRYVAGDEIWLSPFHGGPRASISVHQYHRVPYQPLFRAVEPIFWKYGGRPHWGKLHSLSARQLAPLYPMWDRFHSVRRRLDPGGTFMTPELRKLFEA
jgi:FAD/FMN-containing dehydrogenase